jgi:hypothetical protein
MRAFFRILHALLIVAFGLTGLVAGGAIGYGNGGWIGAVAIGTIGLLVGLFLAAGPEGWGLLLGLLR